MKPTETTGEKGLCSPKRQRNTLGAREIPIVDWKRTCKSGEQDENQAKAPRRSWAGSQMGNASLSVCCINPTLFTYEKTASRCSRTAAALQPPPSTLHCLCTRHGLHLSGPVAERQQPGQRQLRLHFRS